MRIDWTTGLLARTCTPPSRVRKALYVELPDRFRSWQMDRGLSRPPETATECLCGNPTCRPLDAPGALVSPPEAQLAIVHPLDGTEIAVDPSLAPGQQMLALEAAGHAGAVVSWFVDGVAQGTTRGRERIFWRVRPGEHLIEAHLARFEYRTPGDRQTAAHATVRVIDHEEPAAREAADTGALLRTDR